MATTQVKVTPLSKRELEALARKAERAAQDAQQAQDVLFLQSQEQASRAELDALKDHLSSAMEDASRINPAELKKSFGDAVKDLARAKQDEQAALDLKNHALVIMSRRAFQASIHPEIVGAGKQNISKAGEYLGMPYSTVRPYVLAGGALFQQDRAFLLSEPDAQDAAIVNGSFDNNSRKAQIEKRQRAALKAAEQAAKLEAQAAEIESLKQAQAAQEQAQNGQNGQEQAPATDGQQAGQQAAQDGQQEQEQAPAKQDIRDRLGAEMDAALASNKQAPAAQEQAPAAGSSASEDVVKAARELVRMATGLRKVDSKAWQAIRAEVQAQLAELFPQELGKGKGK